MKMFLTLNSFLSLWWMQYVDHSGCSFLPDYRDIIPTEVQPLQGCAEIFPTYLLPTLNPDGVLRVV